MGINKTGSISPASVKRQILARIERNNGKETTRSLAEHFYRYYAEDTRSLVLAHINSLRRDGINIVYRGRSGTGRAARAGFIYLESDVSALPRPLTDKQFTELAETLAINHANFVEVWRIARNGLSGRSREYKRLTQLCHINQDTLTMFVEMARARGWDEQRIRVIFGDITPQEFN